MLQSNRSIKILALLYFIIGIIFLTQHLSFWYQPLSNELLLLFLAAGITTYLSALNLGVTFNLVSGLDFICFYFFGPAALVWLGTAEVVIDNISRRDGWVKLLFNLGQTAIFLTLTTTILQTLNQPFQLPISINFLFFYLISTVLNGLLYLPLLLLSGQYYSSLLGNISSTLLFSLPFYYLIFAAYQASPTETLILVPAFLYLIKKLLQPTLPTTQPEVLDNNVLLYSRKHLFYTLAQLAQKKQSSHWITLLELPDYRDIEEIHGSLAAEDGLRQFVRSLYKSNTRITVYRYTSNQLAILSMDQIKQPAAEPPCLVATLAFTPALISVEEILDQLEQKLGELRQEYQQEKEKQLQQSIRLATIGQLAAGIAHEIRNPLTTVSGFLQLLEWGRELPADTIKMMEEELDRVNQLVTGLLYLSNPSLEHKQREKLNLNELVTSTVELVKPELLLREIELKIELDPGLPELYLNAAQIRQLLINLLQNSYLAVESKGWIKVKTGQDQAHVFLTVQDSGPGIEPDKRELVFQPFFTTRPNAIGLGLTICQQIAANHNGQLELASESDYTTFILKLPLFLNIVS
ncbi:nitrogen regulation protein NR(II) [Carboxydocella sp. ULO1]|uniref:two-component system sensor histidine kinase NtrB n=1 Tax=Carboxydocella sp. ULO1 TaxID=1926599 RepID=UPI0013566517|nr:ATP-binding protein [Carboxydocella sp. ULO1]